MDRTRRGVLGLLAATTGCLGFGGDDEVTPERVTDSPSSATPTRTPTEARTAVGTDTQTTTDTSTPTATDTPTPTATPTPRDAQAPPVDALSLDGASVAASPADGGTATAFVGLRNTSQTAPDGPVRFVLVELRIDVFYESPLDAGPRRVASGYFERRFDETPFGPSQRRTFGGRLPITDSRVDGTEPDRRFSVEFAYRRVRY